LYPRGGRKREFNRPNCQRLGCFFRDLNTGRSHGLGRGRPDSNFPAIPAPFLLGPGRGPEKKGGVLHRTGFFRRSFRQGGAGGSGGAARRVPRAKPKSLRTALKNWDNHCARRFCFGIGSKGAGPPSLRGPPKRGPPSRGKNHSFLLEAELQADWLLPGGVSGGFHSRARAKAPKLNWDRGGPGDLCPGVGTSPGAGGPPGARAVGGGTESGGTGKQPLGYRGHVSPGKVLRHRGIIRGRKKNGKGGPSRGAFDSGGRENVGCAWPGTF